jgi:D-beta-D-heptose 7-phosphate kinase / D-beta-D-heptose 1-phosphate adenosyltransferase
MNEIPATKGPLLSAAQGVAALGRLARASVLVIGDAMLDRSIYGQVSRISPEAPVPILTEEREVVMPGGAGNVVRNLSVLGAAAAFISVVGDDQAGSDLTGVIGGQPNVEPWLLVEGGRTTTVKTRYFAAGQQLLRADREETTPINAKIAERILRIARDAIAATTVTVLSDYRKGVLAGELPQQLIAAAHQAGRKVIADPKGADFSPYVGVDVIIPNRLELAQAAHMPTRSGTEIASAAARIRARHGIGAVLVTCEDTKDAHATFGICDAVVALFSAAVAIGMELPAAVRLVNAATGVVAGEGQGATAAAPEGDERPANPLAGAAADGALHGPW